MMRIHTRQAGQVALISLLLLLGWNTILVYPLKMLVVLFHEASHGLGAILTGGSLRSIEITANEGGLARTVGGWRWVTVSAGYLGSMLWGAAIFKAAHFPRLQTKVSALLGLILLTLTILYVRTFVGVALGLGFAGLLMASSRRLSGTVNEMLLKVIGLTSMFYAVLDIKDDLISRSIPGSDAYAMSKIVPLPPVVWGIIWILLAVVCVFFVVRSSVRQESPTEN